MLRTLTVKATTSMTCMGSRGLPAVLLAVWLLTTAMPMHTPPSAQLLLVTSAGTLRQARPVAYQTIKGRRHRVSVYYVLLGHGRVGLRLGRYDHRYALVIDPVLSYGSYLGGAGTDQATAVALDQHGDLFLTGTTTSADFITTTNAYSTSQASGNYVVFITEISPTGAVSYSTYLGGSSVDYGEGIAVDPAGNAYVTGLTNSSDFPTTTSLYSVHTDLNTTQTLSASVPATGTDAFVVRLTATGGLSYSVRLGSLGGVNATGDTWGRAIAVAPEGQGSSSYDAYVTGQTDSPDFPVTTLSPVGTTRGLPPSPHGTCTQSVNPSTGLSNTTELGSGPCYDAFVVRLTADGSGFVYSTYLGGG